MSADSVLHVIADRIQCRFPLLFLATWEEERWEGELASMALDMERGLVVWTATEGASPPLDTNGNGHTDPAAFLQQVRQYPRDHVFLLKDFHPYLEDPIVVRLLRDLVPTLAEQNKTLIFMSAENNIPLDLRKDAIAVELPLPRLQELREELREVLIQRKKDGEPKLKLTGTEQERLLKTVLGLTAKQARQSMSRALMGRDSIDDCVYEMLVNEKRHMVQGSDMLEFHELAEGAGDVGGLDALKDWIAKRSEAFTERARKKGIPSPKGVLLLGVQGCGKSLTARVVARMLSFPLVRLDVSTLLSSDQGSSEKNMRDVLNLMEMIAPAILWMDEVEKGFSGVDAGGGGGDATMTRIMGRFLTWMQEKPAPVFVVATANSVTSLPPEMLRRGRFDELFFVDLPNYHERKDIFEIHMRKRGLDPDVYNVPRFAEMTEGYSGAEIEQAIVGAMVETFNRGQDLTQELLEHSVEDTVPLSVTMEEKIFQLREWARTRCRQATPDSRVLQMLEEEHREKTGSEQVGTLDLFDKSDFAETDDEEDTWETMVQEGDVRAGLLDYISGLDDVPFSQIQKDFAKHVETEGEFGLALRSDPHVVLWHGMSAEIAAPLARLISDRKVYVHPASSTEYGDAAESITLPKLPGLPESRVPKVSWLPVLISVVAPEDVDERLTRVARMKLSK